MPRSVDDFESMQLVGSVDDVYCIREQEKLVLRARCVKDVAMLWLPKEADYKVEAVSYKNYTIRLVDHNIEEGDFFSLPLHLLYKFNFSDASDNEFAWKQPDVNNAYHATQLQDSVGSKKSLCYEQERVKDVAMLWLPKEAEYKVEAISYKNYTIRLVDHNIEERDYSSLPRHLLYKFNFSDASDYEFA
ncbi:putative receptor-like protein kinase [Arachis hypogaea]|nr:putative receptor-like protein kinase [Arachis hypogaea]